MRSASAVVVAVVVWDEADAGAAATRRQRPVQSAWSILGESMASFYPKERTGTKINEHYKAVRESGLRV